MILCVWLFFFLEYLFLVFTFLLFWYLLLGNVGRSHRVVVSYICILCFSLIGLLVIGYLYFILYNQFLSVDFFSSWWTEVSDLSINFYFDISRGWPFIYIYVFITLITLVYCFAYNYSELLSFQFYVFFILVAGGFLFYSDSLVFFFFTYEAFLIPSFLILYNFAKTRKAVEAAFLMFFWTQLGAVFLIFNFQYLFFISGAVSFTDLSFIVVSPTEMQFLFWSLFVGFGVKFPVWPFYDWLPKAHVEASTNFSIFLSGVLVKFAFFGFLRYFFSLGFDVIPLTVYLVLVIGFLDASTKVYYQLDLKKLIAYSTVIEMHWLVFSVLNGSTFFWVAGFAMMISHALVSANFFILIDSVMRRLKTRVLGEASGLFYLTPNLYFVILLMLIIFLGFPGSLLFVAEFLFFSALLDFSFCLFFIIFFCAYFFVPVCFFRSWFLLLFGLPDSIITRGVSSLTAPDLTTIELILVGTFIFILFWFGLSFQFFL